MGTIYRKTFTKPLPADAEIIVRKGERLARWKDAKGKTRLAPTAGDDSAEPTRITVTAGTYTAKYRTGDGIVSEVATGCRDADAARKFLSDLERRAELVKIGVVTAAENAVADHQGTPLADHFAVYVAHLQAKGVHRTRIANARGRLNRIAAESSSLKLAHLTAAALERWLHSAAAAGMSAPTRNEYRAEVVGFGNWCLRTGRLAVNPLDAVARADANADCRRQRRSLTEAELVRLLDVARRRPLFDALTIRRGKRKGEAAAVIRDDVREQLERLGWERGLIYKTLVLTGLRRGELASITVGQLDLDGPLPSIMLHAADEKNRAGSTLPLRSDLAADLALWVKELRQRHTRDSGAFEGQLCLLMTAVPQTGTLADTPLFTVPEKLVKILDRDLKMAGIAKRDERGYTLDVHALRHTFGTLLSKGGVLPRTAQAAMRHSSIDLTMNTYTDPKLLDVAGALDALPALPLDGKQDDRQEQRATGTYGRILHENSSLHQLAPLLAPKSGQPSKSVSFADNLADRNQNCFAAAPLAVNPLYVNENNPLTTAVNGLLLVERKGVEPSTFALRTRRSPN
jgi:integrase